MDDSEVRSLQLQQAKQSAITRAAHTGQVYYVIDKDGQYRAVSCRDYYMKYQRYEALDRIEIA